MRTYGRAVLTAEGWRLTQVPPHVRQRLKQVFPKIHKTADEPFILPDDLPTAADLDWFFSRYPFDMTESDTQHLADSVECHGLDMADVGRIFQPDYEPIGRPGWKPGRAPRPYQSQAADMLAVMQSLLLLDDVGLGKTVAALAACTLPGALPAFIIVKPHLQRQWQEMIEEFTTFRSYSVKTVKPHQLPRADIYLFRYTQLPGWYDELLNLNLGLVAYDEIQELRAGDGSGWGDGTAKGRAAARLSERARMRLGLSATPIYNYGNEIWNILRFVRPDALGSVESFAIEWMGAGRIVKEPHALGSFLRDEHIVLRRSKRDVGQHLPRITSIVEYVDYDSESLRSIDDLARRLAEKATYGEPLERGDAVRQLDLLVRQQTGIAKAPAVAAYVRILVEAGEPVLLAGWHRECYKIWNKELNNLKPVMYTGEESPKKKHESAQAFIAGQTDLMMISLRSGEGLNGLQNRCSTIIYGELDWSPAVMAQLLGRIDREGQQSPINAIYLVSDDGSDPPMMEMLGLKSSQQHAIRDPGTDATAYDSDPSRLQALVRKYLRARAA